MTDIVKGMADTYMKHAVMRKGADVSMRAALLFLADNVSDEMVRAYRNERESVIRDEWFPSLAEAKTLAAAIRAAAGEEVSDTDDKFHWSASIDATSWDRPSCAFWMCMDCGMFHLGHVDGDCRNCHPAPPPPPKAGEEGK